MSLADSRPIPRGTRGVQATAAVDPVALLRALDESAWQDLYRLYYLKMRNFASARTGDITTAEDIASEVFTAAVRGISSYRPTGAPLAAWLYRIARNITADHVERRRKRPSVPIDGIEIEAPGAEAQLDQHADLARDIATLTREQQELIALRFFNDCSLQETAQAMGKSVGAIKVLQHRALAGLRKQMMTRGETR